MSSINTATKRKIYVQPKEELKQRVKIARKVIVDSPNYNLPANSYIEEERKIVESNQNASVSVVNNQSQPAVVANKHFAF